MTAKRGTLWKTSWRRTGPALGSGRGPLWFFNNFIDANGTNFFEQAAPVPSIGSGAPPFWVGAIMGSTCGTVAEEAFTRRGAGVWNSRLAWTPSSPEGTLQAQGIAAGLTESTDVPPYNSPLSSFQLRAVVTLFAVEPVTGGLQTTLWVDGTVRATEFTANPYVPGSFLLNIEPFTGLLNGVVGGNSLVTDAEVRAWFAATKAALAVQGIPGKTVDRYDAGFTPGLVPPSLLNLAGGQNAALTTAGTPPVPANTLFQATFGY